MGAPPTTPRGYGRAGSAQRSRRALFEELETRFRCFPHITRLRILSTGTPPRPSGPIWARRGALATRRTRPRPHHAPATRTPTPSHVPSASGAWRARTTGRSWTRRALRRREGHTTTGDASYAPISATVWKTPESRLKWLEESTAGRASPRRQAKTAPARVDSARRANGPEDRGRDHSAPACRTAETAPRSAGSTESVANWTPHGGLTASRQPAGDRHGFGRGRPARAARGELGAQIAEVSVGAGGAWSRTPATTRSMPRPK